MKPILKLLFISFLFFQSCDEENCNQTCFTPPSPFGFELLDKTSGENLFTNGTYEQSQIEVMNLNGAENIPFTFINENDLNIIQFSSIGWETGVTNFSLSVGSENIFEMYVDAERKDEECCSFTVYNEVRIDNAEYEIYQSTGIIKILIP